MRSRAIRIAPLVVWSGGGAFVVSLAYFAWTYLVRFDHFGPGAGLLAVIANCALFGAFALHHSLLARPWIKAKLMAVLSPALERCLFVWAASVLFFIVCREWRPVAGVLYWHTGAAAVIHRAVQLIGLAVIGGAVLVIGPLDLAGISLAATSRSPVAIGGPYRIVRHPIYLGWLLLVFGAPYMNGTRLSFAVISTIYLLLAMPWEERALLRTLGASYAQYLARVRWRLVPGLY